MHESNNIKRISQTWVNPLEEFFHQEEEGNQINAIKNQALKNNEVSKNDLTNREISQDKKQPGRLSRIYTKLFGSPQKEEQEIVDTFKQGLKKFSYQSKEFNSHVGKVKELIGKMRAFEKSQIGKPITEETFNKSLEHHDTISAYLGLAEKDVTILKQYLNELKTNEVKMAEISGKYSGFDRTLKEYASIQKIINEQNNYVNYTKEKLSILEQFTYFEEFILNYNQSEKQWDDYKNIQTHVGVIGESINNIIETTPSLKNNKDIQTLLNHSTPLSPQVIRKLVQSVYPDLSTYNDRLFNQFGLIETNRIKALDTKAQKLTALSSTIFSTIKETNQVKKKLNHWSWLSAITNLSSKKSLENKLAALQAKTDSLQGQIAGIGSFNEEELHWLENKGARNSKVRAIHTSASMAQEKYDVIHEAASERAATRDFISKRLDECIRDLNNIFETLQARNEDQKNGDSSPLGEIIENKTSDGLLALGGVALEKVGQFLVVNKTSMDKIIVLDKSLKVNLTAIAKLAKQAANKFIDSERLPPNFSDLSYEGRLKTYLNDIFPELSEKTDQLFTLLDEQEKRRSGILFIEEHIKEAFN